MIESTRKQKEDEDKIVTPSGATSSKCPRFDLIPIEAIIRLANRFELGEIKHGHNNWRKGINDKQYILERTCHIIHHAIKFMHKLDHLLPDDGDDDVGAILWGAAFLCEATKYYSKENSSD